MWLPYPLAWHLKCILTSPGLPRPNQRAGGGQHSRLPQVGPGGGGDEAGTSPKGLMSVMRPSPGAGLTTPRLVSGGTLLSTGTGRGWG